MAEREDAKVVGSIRPTQAIEDRMSARDSVSLSPTERAEAVQYFLVDALGENVLDGALYWDLLSWAVHLVGQAAIASEDEDFITPAKLVNGWLYAAHYSYPDGHPMLAGRRERLEYWVNKTKERK